MTHRRDLMNWLAEGGLPVQPPGQLSPTPCIHVIPTGLTPTPSRLTPTTDIRIVGHPSTATDPYAGLEDLLTRTRDRVLDHVTTELDATTPGITAAPGRNTQQHPTITIHTHQT